MRKITGALWGKTKCKKSLPYHILIINPLGFSENYRKRTFLTRQLSLLQHFDRCKTTHGYNCQDGELPTCKS